LHKSAEKESLNFLCNLLLYLVNVSLLWPNNSFFSLSSEPKQSLYYDGDF
jgi:hypothetical protein